MKNKILILNLKTERIISNEQQREPKILRQLPIQQT